MKFIAGILFILLLALPAFGGEEGCEENLFIIRQWDELVLKDGTVYKGYVNERDDGTYSVRDMRTNVIRTVPRNLVREKRDKSTKEDELKRLAKVHASNPRKLLCVFIEATTRFNLVAESIAMLQEITISNPNEGLLQKLAELYLGANTIDKALRVAEGLVKSNPKSARNLALRGQALAAADKLDLAEKDMNAAMQLAPKDDAIMLAYADTLLRMGRADAAKDIYEKAVNDPVNSRNPSPSTGLAYLNLRSGDLGLAEQNFRRALSIKPTFVRAMLGLAAVKIMNKQYDDAWADCNQILNVDTESSEAYALQGYARIFKSDFNSLNQAERYITDSLKTKPNQPRLLLAWAVMLDRLAKYEELKSEKERNAAQLAQKKNDANAKLNEVLASESADGYIQYFIGEHRFREVETAERETAEGAKKPQDPALIPTALNQAEAAFDRAAKLSPRYAPAHGALGATLLRKKKWEEARAAFAKAAEVADPTSPDAADYVAGQGLTLLKSEKFEQANEFFTKALTANPTCVAALCGRGYIANWQREKARAMDSFQRALAADGDCTYAANALQLIYKQDDREMDYVRFNGADWPKGWKPRLAGTIKIGLENGRAVFSGTQGMNMGNKLELSKDYLGGGFERLEADLQMSPDSPVIFGLRIASGSGPNPAFEFEFGKDESNEIKVRYRDAQGIQPAWGVLKTEWPKTGRVRLGVDTEGIVQGDTIFHLSVNGKRVADVTTKFPQKPTRLSVGMFVQAPPKEVVNASVNNVVVVKRGVTEVGPEIQHDIKIVDPPPVAPGTTTPPPAAPGAEKKP